MLSRNGYFPRPRRVPWSCSLGVAAASDVGTAEDATDAPALAPICAPGGVDATALVGPRERNMALAVAAAAAVVVVERGGGKTAAHADRNAAAFLGARLALPHAPRLARCPTHWLCATASDGFKLQDAAARVPRSLIPTKPDFRLRPQVTTGRLAAAGWLLRLVSKLTCAPAHRPRRRSHLLAGVWWLHIWRPSEALRMDAPL